MKTHFFNGSIVKNISIVCAVLLLFSVVDVSAFAVDNFNEKQLYEECSDSVNICTVDPVTHRAYGYDFESELEYLNSHNLTRRRTLTLAPVSFSPFPASIDNSTSIYFPEIGDQGETGSCTSFASAYYQYTFEINKRDNVATTPYNTCCPQFPYSYFSNGYNSGSFLEKNYETLEKFGCLRYSDYDPADIDTTAEFYRYWNNDEIARLEAIKNTITYTDILVGSSNAFVTFETGTPDDYNLFGVKQLLKDGHLLTFSCNFNYNDMVTSEQGTNSGEMIIVRGIAGNDYGHALTIVGYDDDVCVDVNGDGEIEPAERGAFKIANSWGSDWGNDGFFWLLYDACNPVSQNSSMTWEDDYVTTRTAFIKYRTVYYINVVERNAKFLCIVNLDTPDRYKAEISYYTGHDDRDDTDFEYIIKSNTNLPIISFYGSLVFCVDNATEVTIPDLPDSRHDVLVKTDSCGDVPIVYNSVRITDDLGNNIVCETNSNADVIIYNVNGSRYERDNYFTINYQIGDINYDGNINAIDSSMLLQYMNGNIEISSFQKTLADINSDGEINTMDRVLLMRLISQGAR